MTQKQTYSRPLSFNERSFLVSDAVCSPFANQFFFEGRTLPDLDRLAHAVAVSSEKNPGTRVTLKGKLGMSRWVDSGISPRIRVVDGSQWDGMGPENAPFLQTPLCPFKGPACEIVVIRGNRIRIAFRSHHAIMDGRANLFWAEEVFRALRGEPLMGSNSSLTDTRLAATFQSETRTPPPHEFIAPTGRATGDEKGVVWRRIQLRGKAKKLLAQVAYITANHAWTHGPGKVRFAIPVDLRHHQPGLTSTGNLTNTLYIVVSPESTVDDIHQDISEQIKAKKEGMIYPGDKIIRHLPLWLLEKLFRQEIAKKHHSGQYRNSGILSNMGYLNLSFFSGAGFTADAWFGIPPGVEYLPAFIGMNGYDDQINVMVTMSRALARNGRIEALMKAIKNNIKTEEVLEAPQADACLAS